ncbi:MAG: sorbosone dehydrogenase family protein [Planctomycetota bacterium]
MDDEATPAAPPEPAPPEPAPPEPAPPEPAPPGPRCCRVCAGVLVGLTLLGLLAAWLLRAPAPPPPAPALRDGPRAGLRLEVAFPRLSFVRPLFLCAAPGDAGRLYVVEQGGKVHRFAQEPEVARTEVFLDLEARVSRRGNEEGLLGLAFPPDYARSGACYVYYSAREGGPALGGRSVLARFRRGADGLADPASEEVLLSLDQPFRNHNGGGLCFGPDGYLYLGLGDGGFRGDPEANGQDTSTLLGALLRLDVSRRDGARPYAIPADNPLRGREGARPELYAYGLRNPWRFSFDRATGELWLADVGQDRWEEVDLIAPGQNCGWRRYEGFELYDDKTAAPGATPPLFAYGRGEGVSITGGYVYRGQRLPELVGRYLCADFGSGALWALARDPQAPEARTSFQTTAAGVRVEKLIARGPPVASFGEDAAGELYLCCFDGRVYTLSRGGLRRGATSVGGGR